MIIRKGTPDDLEAAFALVQELAAYEQAPEEVKTSAAQYRKDGFGEKPLFEFFVAEEEEEVLGIALFYFGYSTWKGKMMYLDDLVVKSAARRRGIGELLFKQLVAYAKEQNARQLRWHVLDWNRPAIQFYEKIEARLDSEWITCKLEQEDMAKW
ncbi:MAG: GNAT family N-acetyltransferase [Bacteroidota bacterium]